MSPAWIITSTPSKAGIISAGGSSPTLGLWVSEITPTRIVQTPDRFLKFTPYVFYTHSPAAPLVQLWAGSIQTNPMRRFTPWLHNTTLPGPVWPSLNII